MGLKSTSHGGAFLIPSLTTKADGALLPGGPVSKRHRASPTLQHLEAGHHHGLCSATRDKVCWVTARPSEEGAAATQCVPAGSVLLRKGVFSPSLLVTMAPSAQVPSASQLTVGPVA